MAQVRWSLTAGNDLRDSEDFIARDSVLHAVTFVDRIIEAAETLLKDTHLGRVVRLPIFEKFCSAGYRIIHLLQMTSGCELSGLSAAMRLALPGHAAIQTPAFRLSSC